MKKWKRGSNRKRKEKGGEGGVNVAVGDLSFSGNFVDLFPDQQLSQYHSVGCAAAMFEFILS
jgi:hypothetical protein